MDRFFGPTPVGWRLVEFSWQHWLIVAVIAALIATTVAFARQLRARPRLRHRLPIVVIGVAWACEIVFHWWTWLNDIDFLVNLIPLELCYIALILSAVLVATGRQWVFEIHYFLSIGAVASLLFPDQGGFGADHFRFWHYFIVHTAIVWLAAWYLSVERFRLRRSALWRLLVVLVPLVALARWVDWRFNVGYMFLNGPGDMASPLDFLGTGVGYLVKLVLLGLAIFTLMYLAGPKQPRGVALADAGSTPGGASADNSA